MKFTLRQLRALSHQALLELYRRKDLPVVFILAAVVLLPLSLFTPFETSGINRTLNEVALLLVWLFSTAIAMGVAARLFPVEFESRTIYPLLAKPVSRTNVLLGKYIGALVASLSALAILYLAYALLALARQGSLPWTTLLQAFALHAGFIALLTALTLLGSLLLTASANLTLVALTALGMLLFGARLPALAAAQTQPGRAILQVLHWCAPHFEFFDLRQRLVHDWPAAGWVVCGAALLYAAGYAALCLGLSALALRRRKL